MAATVLVIDDNRPNLHLMAYLLRAFGYNVVEASDGSQSLEAVRQHQFDLIVCDVQLPDIDGYELVRRFKQDNHLKGIPVIAVTALAMVGDRERILSTGFDGYIAKPISPQQFVAALEEYLPEETRSFAKPIEQTTSNKPESQTLPDYRATILAVDDQKTNLAVLKGILEPNGFRLLTANSGKEARSLLQSFTPDLILSDMHLVREEDFEFIRSIKSDSKLATIPFVFISSTTKKESVRAEGLELGALKFIFRPIEPQALLKEIKDCLRLSGD